MAKGNGSNRRPRRRKRDAFAALDERIEARKKGVGRRGKKRFRQ
ncbi:MAG: hypothetical protein PHU04_04930 [Candidatus Peribacteraceae bacterium]|nr:hypothetical protein [Candidatus Peribacteraceae bacterium]